MSEMDNETLEDLSMAMVIFESTTIQERMPYTGGDLKNKTEIEQWKNEQYYNNGSLNNQFRAFFAGYLSHKAVVKSRG